MAKTKISEFDIDPSNNTDINSINIAEGCAPSGINNAIRQLMSDLKEQQTGAAGDNFTVGGNLVVNGTSVHTGATTFSGATTFGGAVVFSSSVDISSGTVANATVKNYTESVVSIGTVTTASTLSLTNGTVQTATLTASTACTFTMPTPTAGKSFVLLLKQAASTGNGTATFTGVKWSITGTPVMTATAGKMDIYSFFSDGTNWYGSYTQGYTP